MQIPFNTGNFDLSIDFELNEDTKDKVLKSGAIYIVQRDGASKAYLDLCGVENDKGKKQLPKTNDDGSEWTRKSLPYSVENADAMVAAFIKALKPYGTATITATEHVSGAEVSPMKRATEFVDSLLGNAQNEATLRQFLSMYDAKAADADREGLIEIANANGVGKAKPKAA